MPRVSVCLSPEIAAWAKAEAADRNMSASRFIASLLRQRRAYLRAVERLLVKKTSQLREPGEPRSRRRDLPDGPRRWRRD